MYCILPETCERFPSVLITYIINNSGVTKGGVSRAVTDSVTFLPFLSHRPAHYRHHSHSLCLSS